MLNFKLVQNYFIALVFIFQIDWSILMNALLNSFSKSKARISLKINVETVFFDEGCLIFQCVFKNIHWFEFFDLYNCLITIKFDTKRQSIFFN